MAPLSPSSPFSNLFPKLLKGALIRFTQKGNSSFPDKIIVFQYNPETMTRKLEAWYSGESESKSGGPSESSNAQPFDPTETFDITLQLDAADALEKPLIHPIAVLSGVADRIAALEMLLYPQGDQITGLLGAISKSLGNASSSSQGGSNTGAPGNAGAGTTQTPIPRGTVPDLLFVWGPGRIVPVRITSFSVEEQAYSPTLYPLRAKVSLGMKIMAPRNFPCAKNQSTKLAITTYNMYIEQKKFLAEANMANNAESILKSFI